LNGLCPNDEWDSVPDDVSPDVMDITVGYGRDINREFYRTDLSFSQVKQLVRRRGLPKQQVSTYDSG